MDTRSKEQVEADTTRLLEAGEILEQLGESILAHDSNVLDAVYRANVRSALRQWQALKAASNHPGRPSRESLIVTGGNKLYLGLWTSELLPTELRGPYISATSAWYDAVPQSMKDTLNHEIQLRPK